MLGGTEYRPPDRCASFDVYNLHANVAIQASDRAGLERLCSYMLRRGDWGATGLRARPLAQGRIERLTGADGGSLVRVGMKRLAALIPPPRANVVLYRGILAGNAALRAEGVPKLATSTEADADVYEDPRRAGAGDGAAGGRRKTRGRRRELWVER